ncbi:AI-2E family transporter [Chitinimonas arctica]|uniref:AI-2E family transporter n=1 Tax=Chitinimonas arctica TaxID=2594795 RepID=A0A516SHB2_9NEIS|nr:AI-2E family transporter [Chitinimonas arctica]QDQ27554.1 AI-2E family transporter [Chitinimonas arctica]
MNLPASPLPSDQGRGWVGIGLLLIATVFLLQAAKVVLLPIALAVMLAFVLAGPVRWLRRWGVPEVVGGALVVLALLSMLGLLSSLLAKPAVSWWERAPANMQQLVESIDRLRSAVPVLAPPRPLPSNRASRAAPVASPSDPVKEKLASEGLALTQVVLAQFGSFAVAAAATIILLYFLLISEKWMVLRLVEAMPRRRQRAMLLAGLRDAQREIGRFLATMSMINLGLGVATTFCMWLIDMPNPALWGAMAGLFNFIPYLGPLTVSMALLLAGVLTYDTLGQMLAPVGIFLGVTALESNLISPWIVGRRLQLSQVAVFLSVMIWGWIWGVMGGLLAVPILLAIRCASRRRRRNKLFCAFLDRDGRAPPSLQSLLRIKRRPPGAGKPKVVAKPKVVVVDVPRKRA